MGAWTHDSDVRRHPAHRRLRPNARGEVLRPMASGLTDAKIAGRPGAGPAAAKMHVASVPARTGARDRTQG
ncbi:hypothetical protein GTY87_09455 [Streptomyces sp. SID7813]|uniref:Uncharacterized protein n=1 Tax=Streptomyces coelicolor (strain ATCC BAA-471 / A3(2) / M145) TaxID=100226 RepID=Q93RV2_STRCO|nr:hypothetical protein [Streptomyces sp. SID7813]QFI47670.1 hypothetical protein FQ762_09550 [Streptomyces coelicolor A3(2)]CAC38809.1 hypothetical protein [Streptomyces coelicolor A3(2)]